jgi:hypothetical protein
LVPQWDQCRNGGLVCTICYRLCQVYTAVLCVPTAARVPGIHCGLVCTICYRCAGIHCRMVCTICYRCVSYTLLSGVSQLLPVCQVYTTVCFVTHVTIVPSIHCSLMFTICYNCAKYTQHSGVYYLQPVCQVYIAAWCVI